jgi:hypothetical protein
MHVCLTFNDPVKVSAGFEEEGRGTSLLTVWMRERGVELVAYWTLGVSIRIDGFDEECRGDF